MTSSQPAGARESAAWHLPRAGYCPDGGVGGWWWQSIPLSWVVSLNSLDGSLTTGSGDAGFSRPRTRYCYAKLVAPPHGTGDLSDLLLPAQRHRGPV